MPIVIVDILHDLDERSVAITPTDFDTETFEIFNKEVLNHFGHDNKLSEQKEEEATSKWARPLVI